MNEREILTVYEFLRRQKPDIIFAKAFQRITAKFPNVRGGPILLAELKKNPNEWPSWLITDTEKHSIPPTLVQLIFETLKTFQPEAPPTEEMGVESDILKPVREVFGFILNTITFTIQETVDAVFDDPEGTFGISESNWQKIAIASSLITTAIIFRPIKQTKKKAQEAEDHELPRCSRILFTKGGDPFIAAS